MARLRPPTAAAGAPGPDAELFDLLSQLAEARRIHEAASLAADHASLTVQPIRDAVPDALRPRDGDAAHGIEPPSSEAIDDPTRRHYGHADVEAIRRALGFRERHRAGYLERFGKPAASGGDGEARCREIVATHDAWQAEIQAAEKRSGYDEACGPVLDLEARIHNTPAATLAGLAAKAAVEVVVAERAGDDDGPGFDLPGARGLHGAGVTRTGHAVALVALALWWAPTFAAAAVLAAPHLAAGLGSLYRVRRVRRLIARGDPGEAERVLAAIRRDQAAAARWLNGLCP